MKALPNITDNTIAAGCKTIHASMSASISAAIQIREKEGQYWFQCFASSSTFLVFIDAGLDATILATVGTICLFFLKLIRKSWHSHTHCRWPTMITIAVNIFFHFLNWSRGPNKFYSWALAVLWLVGGSCHAALPPNMAVWSPNQLHGHLIQLKVFWTLLSDKPGSHS